MAHSRMPATPENLIYLVRRRSTSKKYINKFKFIVKECVFFLLKNKVQKI